MVRGDQVSIPCAYIRGGSSKAVFFHEADLPPVGPLRDRVLLSVIGSPDPIQIDGMGGTKATTSKSGYFQSLFFPIQAWLELFWVTAFAPAYTQDKLKEEIADTENLQARHYPSVNRSEH